MNVGELGHYYDVGIRVLCFIAAVVFIVRFTRVDWRATPDGKHIMAFTAMIASFLLLIILTWVFGRDVWIVWAGRAVFLWALFLLIQRVLLQRKAQKELEAGKPEENHQPPVSNKRKEKHDLDKGILEGNSGTGS